MKYVVARNNKPVSILGDFDSLFDSFWNGGFGRDLSVSKLPAVDIKEHDTSYTLEAEMPGMDEKNLSVKVEDHVLRISSQTVVTNEEKKEEGKYLIRERRESSFERSFALPENVDEDNITAEFKNGILTLTIPKSEVAKPKSITVKIA